MPTLAECIDLYHAAQARRSLNGPAYPPGHTAEKAVAEHIDSENKHSGVFASLCSTGSATADSGPATFGEALRWHRDRLGISVPTLARWAGFCRQWVSEVENGHEQPTRRTVSVLADALGLKQRERVKFMEIAGYVGRLRRAS